MRETIELRKRTPSEQEAYMQGLTAGIRMGAPMQTVLVLQIERFISPEDGMELRREIEAQMKVAVAAQEALAREKEAEGKANAAKISADAEAYAREVQGKAEAAYYESLSKYSDIITALRQLDIDEQRAKKWNGVEVSTYVPLTGTGAIVTLQE